MQLSRLVFTAALATLAVAVRTRRDEIGASQCTTGPVQCCESIQKATNPGIVKILDSLGIVVEDPDILIGVTCTPISIVGAGGDSCSTNPVCCKDNSFGGVVAIDCVPVDLDL
ncbi:fungal hydrophobin [Dendrothele bispora CBS 962.96]|uniref:Hydrophobin n=1 Tax=Dendrothele bispora (strain CBS 962.96) TaxID=1314807 RepID=A0A4V4HCN4_DENBC|nr:fungal hydrophobin [Dendrothele bispora CBS 962.96]